MSDCLQALHETQLKSNIRNSDVPTVPHSPSFNSYTQIGENNQLFAISSKAQIKTPLVNVPTFNDLENQQFQNDNNKVFMRYQTNLQKRNENFNTVVGERKIKREGSKTFTTYRNASQVSNEI